PEPAALTSAPASRQGDEPGTPGPGVAEGGDPARSKRRRRRHKPMSAQAEGAGHHQPGATAASDAIEP
ncbi:MAG: hypothetical protein WAM94_01175, partial [Chromatiaceae bacterium]